MYSQMQFTVNAVSLAAMALADDILTREQMIALKTSVDSTVRSNRSEAHLWEGRNQQVKSSFLLPPAPLWRDRSQILFK